MRSLLSSSTENPRSVSFENVSRETFSKRAETKQDLHPVRIKSLDVRLPKIIPMASINMDLPAPVSPVKTENPEEKLIERFSMIAMFSI
jgi:hypothetical protein